MNILGECKIYVNEAKGKFTQYSYIYTRIWEHTCMRPLWVKELLVLFSNPFDSCFMFIRGQIYQIYQNINLQKSWWVRFQRPELSIPMRHWKTAKVPYLKVWIDELVEITSSDFESILNK